MKYLRILNTLNLVVATVAYILAAVACLYLHKYWPLAALTLCFGGTILFYRFARNVGIPTKEQIIAGIQADCEKAFSKNVCYCTKCGQLTTTKEAVSRKFNTGLSACCGALLMTYPPGIGPAQDLPPGRRRPPPVPGHYPVG